MLRFKKVLAATDGSEHGLAAVVTGAAYARRAGVPLEVVTVVEVLMLPPGLAPADVKASEHELEFIREARQRIEEQAREAGATDAKLHVRAGLAPQLISRVVEEVGAELVVVGANPEPALARSLVGSTGRRIVYLSQRPVLVANAARREPFRRVLAAVDLSEQSPRVLEAAWGIAGPDGAEMKALYVLEPLPKMLARVVPYDEGERRLQGREQVEMILESLRLGAEPRIEALMREGHAGREILLEAREWNADLIVLGTHGFGFWDRLLLGSTSLYVLRHGQGATLVVPRREHEGGGGRTAEIER